jgi:hypothetical protein
MDIVVGVVIVAAIGYGVYWYFFKRKTSGIRPYDY